MYLHVDVLARTYDELFLDENLKYVWKLFPKAFFLPKIKDWSYSLKWQNYYYFQY